MSNVNQGWKDVPVDWEALEDAFENNAPEVHSYLQVRTGEVLRVVDGIADPDMHSRIALDPNYMRIDPVSSREQYRWMERFIPMVEDSEIQSRLLTAIDGKGAFRRFKDVLMAYAAERERWFAFRSERLRVFMEAWLSAHGLKPIARPPVALEGAPAADEAPVEVVTQEQLGGRRVRGTDTLRKQLLEAVEGLTSRDLDKVVSYAEFLKSRRTGRGSRGEVTPPASPEPTEVSVEDSAAGPPTAQSSREPSSQAAALPSSQRRAADRR
jgi:hypothetical protein